MRFYRTQAGYTVIELLVVIVVIGVLSGIIFTNVADSRMRGRDTERATDIDVLSSRLEEYYNDRGGYPNTLNASILTGIDPASLVDPNGASIVNETPVADQATARAATNPTASGANYKYIPYPTGCTAITCTGYVLKTAIEQPTGRFPNPYVRYGLNNN